MNEVGVYSKQVEVKKIKKGVPTVITIDGREYIWVCPTTRPPAQKKAK